MDDGRRTADDQNGCIRWFRIFGRQPRRDVVTRCGDEISRPYDVPDSLVCMKFTHPQETGPVGRLFKHIYTSYIYNIHTSVEMLSKKFYEEQGLASLSRASLTTSFASIMPVIPAAKEEKGPMNFLLDLAAGGTGKDGVGGWDGGLGIVKWRYLGCDGRSGAVVLPLAGISHMNDFCARRCWRGAVCGRPRVSPRSMSP